MNRKNFISLLLFLSLMGLTFYTILKGNDMAAVWRAAKDLSPLYLLASGLASLFFVSSEGLMIWYLLKALDNRISPLRCVRFSFIGFFYSGITPSATGGQPVQLYYMKKSGLPLSDSTVVLMAVALIYKFVLVLMGVGILLVWSLPLKAFLQDYIYLYYLGLSLNVLLVAVLMFLMVSPRCFGRIVNAGERLLVRLHVLKPSNERLQKLSALADSYHEAVLFFLSHKRHIAVVTLLTVLQRCSVFLLTWLIYKGMHLSGHGLTTVMALQASVYIAVDMLPLPGAQGITELMYKTVFSAIFPGACLTASMCVTRGVNFYLPLLVSGLVAGFTALSKRSILEKKIVGRGCHEG